MIYVHSIWGRFPFWLFFSSGLKPPTRFTVFSLYFPFWELTYPLPNKGTLEDHCPFPKVGYVSSLKYMYMYVYVYVIVVIVVFLIDGTTTDGGYLYWSQRNRF